MDARKFPETLYSDIDPDDLTTSSCYSAIIKLKILNMKLDSDNAEMVIRSLQRNLADFLDYNGRFYIYDDNEITSLFKYVPDYANLTTEKIEQLLSYELPEGYIHYSGRVYRFIDHVVIPHSYQQYWVFMYLNIKNYDLLYVDEYLDRQLLLASDKQQFLSVFKNVIRQNYHGIHDTGVQDYLYEWIDNQQQILEAQSMALDKRYNVKASYNELMVFFTSRFEQGVKDLSPILLPDQVENFVHANFSCPYPATERQKFRVKRGHIKDVKRTLWEFHNDIVYRKGKDIDMACNLLIDNFDMHDRSDFASLKSNFSRWKG